MTDDHKYGWFQGRQLYTYARLFNRIEPRQQWLDNAEHGYRFLRDKVYAGNGRWNYRLNRKGEVLIGTTSIFSDYHNLQGLGEYMAALHGTNQEGVQLVRECFDTMERNMFDPNFKEIYENVWSEKFIWHDMYMTCLSAVLACIPVLGEDYTRRLADECVNKILKWFARDDRRLLFEAVTRDNQIDMTSVQGRFINPGHAMESVWFLMQLAQIRKDPALMRRAPRYAIGRTTRETTGSTADCTPIWTRPAQNPLRSTGFWRRIRFGTTSLVVERGSAGGLRRMLLCNGRKALHGTI